MIGNIVKFVIAIGAVLQIISGMLIVVGIFNVSDSFSGMALLFGGIIIAWGLFILAGLSKLHEKKR